MATLQVAYNTNNDNQSSPTGDIVVTQPSTTDYVIRIIGAALTVDEIFFRPSNDYITHI
jgi:hypothetical protein